MHLSQQRQFPRSLRSVGEARAFAIGTLATWGVVDRHDEIKLCVSELATNALLHGVPKGRAFEVSFLISTDEAELRVEVRDSGDGRLVATAPTGDACTGRGLHLVRELADDFGVIEHVVGKTVWLTFKALHLPAVPHRSGGPSSPDRHEGDRRDPGPTESGTSRAPHGGLGSATTEPHGGQVR
ncbi:ATP-binding protein [Streptomyces sp. NPDC032198]|uniref:ATP-binding protein n=1 Tax=unclassified Streptomyces TaxID=2593676 RepID=UPI0033D84E48